MEVFKKMQTVTARCCRVCNKHVTNSYRSLHLSKMYHTYLIEMGLSVEGFLCYPCVRKLDKLVDIDDKLSGGLNKTRADLITFLLVQSKPAGRDLPSQSVSSPTIPEYKARSPLHLGCEGDRWKKLKETLCMATDAMLAKHLLDIHKRYCSCDVDVKNTLQDDILMNEKRQDIMDSSERKRNLQMEPTIPSKIMRICPSSGDCIVGASNSDDRSVQYADYFKDSVNMKTANTDMYVGFHSDTNSEEARKLMAGEDFAVYKAEEDDVESSEEEADSSVTTTPGVINPKQTETMATDRLPVKQETPDSDDDAVGKSSCTRSYRTFGNPLDADPQPQDGTDHSSFPIKEEPPCSDSGQDLQDLDRDETAEHSPSVEAGVLIPSPSLSSGGLLLKLASFAKSNSTNSPGTYAEGNPTDISQLESPLSDEMKVNTVWGVNLLKQWLSQEGKSEDFESLSYENLNNELKDFYAELRNCYGDYYSNSSYFRIRRAIQRHLCQLDRNMNLLVHKAFKTSNIVFRDMIRKIKSRGLNVTPRVGISKDDLSKIHQTQSLKLAADLQMKIWFDLSWCFGRGVLWQQQELTKESFAIFTDQSGLEYIAMTSNERNELSAGRNHGQRRHVYATGSPLCLVAAYKKYISKLHPDCSSLFQWLQKDVLEKSSVWYRPNQISLQSLAKMMPTISTIANLSTMYNNRSVCSQNPPESQPQVLATYDSGGIMKIIGYPEKIYSSLPVRYVLVKKHL